jgi:hypothetical protein
MGDNEPGAGSSTVAMCAALDTSVVLLLNSGFGISSVSIWKACCCAGGDGSALL